jgi:hypothetical protein
MGNVATISLDKWPKQGKHLGERAEVCFHYDTSKTIMGTIVRDDMEHPFRTIIKLDDGRYIEAAECQYALRQHPTETTELSA